MKSLDVLVFGALAPTWEQYIAPYLDLFLCDKPYRIRWISAATLDDLGRLRARGIIPDVLIVVNRLNRPIEHLAEEVRRLPTLFPLGTPRPWLCPVLLPRELEKVCEETKFFLLTGSIPQMLDICGSHRSLHTI